MIQLRAELSSTAQQAVEYTCRELDRDCIELPRRGRQADLRYARLSSIGLDNIAVEQADSS